jgi:L-lactate dehydrogenase (cytochrome)
MPSDARLARAVRSPHVVNIHDFRRLAKRRLPPVVFEYVDGGAEDEVTLRENSRAFADVTFRPRQCVPVPACDLRTTVLGTTFELPFLLAPIGSCRMLYPRAEALAAREANLAGTGYVLSSFSGTLLEEVRADAPGTLWYQLYTTGGRAVVETTLARARAAGFTVLVVTIDTPVAGMRERDFRNGARPLLGGDLRGSLPHLWQFVTHPGWVAGFLRDGAVRVFPNIEIPGVGPVPNRDVGRLLEETLVTWNDLGWMREAWQGPVLVKGVHTGDDARCAVDAGADGVIVSNHGGRQLDGVPASLRALPEVLAAVGGQVEVLMDGGVRRGADIVKALAIGARAVLVGRAYAWAVAAAGGPGVARAIEILRADVVRTMKLLGCDAVAKLDRSYIDVPRDWTADLG